MKDLPKSYNEYTKFRLSQGGYVMDCDHSEKNRLTWLKENLNWIEEYNLLEVMNAEFSLTLFIGDQFFVYVPKKKLRFFSSDLYERLCAYDL